MGMDTSISYCTSENIWFLIIFNMLSRWSFLPSRC
uniref:Uncharacterized protein n=1 Tax=Arundo donax TaxID=35708 RepID=A0A0A9FAF7_ARUDO